ncbi:MAG: CHASE2 domain-containing protein [Phototrophicales bacterium]|nr:CHASE2 domain-containing protein [Phototrophicales bacterium]
MWHILNPIKPLSINKIRQGGRGALVGFVIGVVLLVLWVGGLFAQTRLRLNDAYYAPSPTTGQVMIVAIDNASLSAYGRSPSEWSRDRFTDFLNIASEAGARTVGFDLLFSETTPDDEQFINAIIDARQSEARTRVIMPMVGLTVGADDYTQSVEYADVLMPHSGFGSVVENRGFVNVYPDADSTIRRQISSVQYATADGIFTGHSFAIALYLAYLRIPTPAIPQVVTAEDGALNITPERQIRVDVNGLWMPNYFGSPATDEQSAFVVVSFLDVLEGRVDPAIFADKAVLVGVMNSTGITDVYAVPTSIGGTRMSGVEIHAHAFESLLQNISFREQSSTSQLLMILGLAIFTSMVYSQLRWWAMLIIGAVMMVAMSVAIITYFDMYLVMVNLFYALLAGSLPIGANLMLDIVTETTRRQLTEAQLSAEKQVSALRLQVIAEKDQQNATLNELSMLKTRMILMASHDLKNPLGIVLTYGSLIIEDVQADNTVMSQDHARFVESMVKSGHDMLYIIEEILNLEQLRSGNIKKDTLAFGFLVKEVVERNLMSAEEKKQTLTLVNPPDLPLVQGDYRQLFQAITNLVGNAVKYTPDNGIITVKLLQRDDMVRFEVQDNGYGISEEGQKNLFQEFYRVRSAKTAHIQGTGLGLSLVKAVIEAHGGTIWMTSTEGVGSTFFVELPLFEGTLEDE